MRGMPIPGSAFCRMATGAVLAVSMLALNVCPAAAQAKFKVRGPVDVRVQEATVGSATNFLAVRLPPKPPPKPSSPSQPRV